MYLVSEKRLPIAIGLLSLIVVVVLSTFFLLFQEQREEGRRETDLTRTESFGAQYLDRNGNIFSLSDTLGSISIVYIWASWSPQSIGGLTILSELSGIYGDRGVLFLGMNRKEERAVMESYLTSIGDPQGIQHVYDTGDVLFKDLGDSGMPRMIIFGTDGNVQASWQGTVSKEDITRTLDSLLAQT